jgi:hypothetical protein
MTLLVILDPAICVPGVARVTVHNFDFDNYSDHDEEVDQSLRNPESNDEKKNRDRLVYQ